MKKTIASIVLSFLFLNTMNAQNGGLKKGDTYASGLFGVSHSKSGDEKATDILFSPSVGYMVNNNIALGLSAGYGSSVSKLGSVKTSEDIITSAGVFVTYYFNPQSKFSMFGTAGVGYLLTNDKLTDEKFTGIDVGISPGVSYFVSNNLALQATIGRLGFSSLKSNEPGAEATNKIDLGLNLATTNFGLIWKF